MGFTPVPHTADMALHVWGESLHALFVQAAAGLAWLLAGPVVAEPTVEARVDLAAVDAETLLVTWLSELLYLNERDGTLFTTFELERIGPTHLQGRIRGVPAVLLQRQVKAVTFNELAIRSSERGLETTIVFDV